MATDFADAESIIRQKFDTGWGTTTPIRWDNTDADLYPPDEKEWVRLSIQPGAAAQVAMPNDFRHSGIIFVQVFVEKGIGEGRALDLADAAAAIFRGQSANGITYRAPSPSKAGPREGYYQINVSIPYQWDAQF